MKKLFNAVNRDSVVEVYDKLQNNRKKIKRHAIIMIIFLFGVNAFAWFAYISKADFNFDATVVAWDVNFYNDSTEVSDVIIDVGEIYPGFGDTAYDSNNLPYKKIIEVSNTGEVSAAFSYEVNKFKIMGQDALVGEYSSEEFIKLMEDTYPFTIKMSATSNKLNPNESLNYEFDLYWLFEENNKYYKLNHLYTYDPSFTYYTYSGGSYKATDVTALTFPTLRDTLYLEKDDADSYFGNKCAAYEANTGEKCVSVGIQLKVAQVLD